MDIKQWLSPWGKKDHYSESALPILYLQLLERQHYVIPSASAKLTFYRADGLAATGP